MLNQKTTASVLRAAAMTIFTLFLLTQMSACKNDKEEMKVSGTNGGMLSYVPADTIFFLGGLEPISVKETFKLFGENSGLLVQAFKDSLDKTTANQKNHPPPAGKMIVQLAMDYFESLENPDKFAKTLGIDDEMQFAVYSVGMMPVMRMHLKNKAAFESFIENSEKKAGVKGNVETLGSAKIRTYSFDQAPDPKSLGATFVIGTQGDYAVISAKVAKLDEDINRQIVGDIKPKTALKKDVLSKLASDYHFDPRYLLYLDHKQIMRGLTHSDNQFGAMLSEFVKLAEKNKMEAMADSATKDADPMNKNKAEKMSPAMDENPFAKIQTPACQKELTAKVETWPRTVGGYTTMDFNSKPAKFDFKGIVEIHDPKFIKSLASLRGVVPSYLSDSNKPMVFGFGLGLNVDAVAPFVTQYVQDFTSKNYQCEFLAEMKQNMQASNPAMGIAMMTGMAAGVYGVSASLLNFQGDFDPNMQTPPDIKNLQAIITVSAKNPQMLLMMLSKLQPGMPPIQLPPDGKAIDFPMPIPAPEPIKLAQKGKHIVAYIGKEAAALADAVQKQPLQGNGLLLVNVDYQKYFSLLSSSMSKSMKNPSAKDPEFEKMMKLFESMKYRVVEGMDVSDKGIEFSATLTVN